jgi:N-acetylglucosaminyldiphosphoundecaprenol N-acetyl-beta-D-mannosaminyltransferase
MSIPHKKIDVAGLKISAITKQDLLTQISERIAAREKTFVTTPYSEFLYASLRQPKIRALLNSSDFAIPDGVAILWAHLFLSVPLTASNFYLKILQASWQVVWTGASILLNPKLIRRDIPEKIVGADLIWDLSKLAAEKNFKAYLLGGWGSTTEIVAQKLQAKYPNLQIAGTSTKQPDDISIVDDINAAAPDMVFVALGALTQEQWIADNLSKTSASFAIGLGGTFDYIAGVKKQPPKFIRSSGLEWLYRLITQPSRIGRIYRGVIGLIVSLIRHKIFLSTPLRSNGVAVVINSDGKILLCKRSLGPAKYGGHPDITFPDYWQFPQGGLDKGEEAVAGAQRELFEETGIRTVTVISLAKYINQYDWNNSARPLFTSRYANRGQHQFTVFFKFTGTDDEIKLDKHELVDYQWLSPAEVINVIAPERRAHAEAVLAELAQIQV